MRYTYVLGAGLLLANGCLDERPEDLALEEQAIANGSPSGSSPTTNAMICMAPNGGGCCSGALVSPNTVLTAGHCLYGSWVEGDDFEQYDEDWHVLRHDAFMVIRFGPDPDNPIHTAVARKASWANMIDKVNGTGHDDIALLAFDTPVPSTIAIPRRIVYGAGDGELAGASTTIYGYGGGRDRQFAFASDYESTSWNYADIDVNAPATLEPGDSGAPILWGGTTGPIIGVNQNLSGGNVKTYGQGYPGMKPDIGAWLRKRSIPARRAWVWTTSGTAAGNLASSSYTHNSTGRANTVTRLSTGYYSVELEGVGGDDGGQIQVVAYGGGNQRCKLRGWSTNWLATASITVNCHDAATGAYADSQFVLSYVDAGHQGARGAHLYASQATTSTYTPPAQYQWSSSGELGVIQRTATGVYRVLLPVQQTGGSVNVTAFGTTAAYCKSSAVAAAAFGSLEITVRCFDNGGVPVDHRFNLQYERPLGFGTFAYGHAVQPANTSWYIAGDWFSVADQEDPEAFVLARKTTTGRHSMFFQKVTSAASGALVTASGSGATYCKPVLWQSGTFTDVGDGTSLSVACFGPGGAPVDAQFDATYLQPTAWPVVQAVP